ncbi:MAG: carboxypeptidase regulatory-like domain-containing protein [Anaerolineae bacterium]|nr:carboxypeptidase regulatory-like domain-containing protein [Anaerolineae bacterium]
METGDSVAVQISTDGGANYTTVMSINGPSTDPTYRTAILPLSGLTTNSAVRFQTNAAMDSNDLVWIDNVRISNATTSWMANYTYTYTGSGFGDLLRACWNGSTWVLENNGTCGSITTAGANNGQGPSTAGTYPNSVGSPFTGYGEFYWDDSGPGSRNANAGVTAGINGLNYYGHEQTMMGGIFQQAGLPDVAVTIADQFGFGDGGLARFSSVVDHPDITLEPNGNLNSAFGVLTYPTVFSNGVSGDANEAGLALKHTQLYGNATGFFAKANGLGDVEALTNPAPLEIGNYVWRDTNGNGRQDPGEAILSGVVVELWKDTNNDGIADTKVAEDTTDANGNYLFSSNTNTNNPGENWSFTADKKVLTDTTYEIRILRTQAALTGPGFTVPTLANADAEIRDSDGVAIADTGGGGRSITGVRFTTGGPGVNDHTYDFGFFDNENLVNLGNQVWFDYNNDGLLNNGETGINGVRVELYADSNADGRYTPGVDSFISFQTTATVGPDAGIYEFTGLLPGDYVVVIPTSNFGTGQPLNGMASSTGNNPAPDPDNNVDNDDNGYQVTPQGDVASLAITLQSGTEPTGGGDTNWTVDFGFFGLGAIGNYVWVDEDSNGYQDEGEPGIPNVQVNLYDAAGNLVATTYTDSHGGYLFDNLPPGNYYVDVWDGTGGTTSTLPFTGMTQTPPSTLPNADFGNQAHTTPIPSTSFTGYPVTIGGSEPLENLTADFGYNYNPQSDVINPPANPGGNPSNAAVAALGDRVWIDSNGNGAQDPNEIGVGGAVVTLYNDPDGDGIYDTPYGGVTVTNANGYYMFDGLPPGAYVARVTDSSGATHDILNGSQYAQTGDPDHFGVPGTGVPADTDNATTTPVLLGPGDVFLNADFGYQPTGATLGSIGDTIWFDANANGTGPSLPPYGGGSPVTQGNAANPADTSEYGIPGVTVVLIRDTDGNGEWNTGEPIIATTTTDASGQYLFPGLPLTDGTGTDDYIVWVNDTNNVLGEMVPTYDKNGAAPTAGLKTGLGISSVTNLGTTGGGAYGTNNALDQDFGYTNTYQTPNPQNPSQPLGLIGDYVWFDTNRDNIQDGTESGVEGVKVELLNSTGTQVLATTYTDENGYYSFGGLPLNTSYIVNIPASNFAGGAPLEGTTNTGGPTGGSGNTGPVVNLTPANPVNLVQDFGYAAPPGAQGSIGNQIWEDLNADGIRQGGEPAIAGVTVDLYRDLNGNGTVDPGEPLMGTQTTDASGLYLFDSLPIDGSGTDGAAAYIVDVTDVDGVLAGYWHSQGSQNAYTGISGNTANDSQDNSKVDPFAVQIGDGTTGSQPVPNNLNVDFGYYVKPAAVGNFVWIDSNANGIQDAGEPGIDGVLIEMSVRYPDGTIHSVYTVTGDDPSTAAVEQGWYSFGNLLQDENYRQSSSTTTPQPNEPSYVIVSPPDVITVGSTTYHLTAPTQGANTMIDSNNLPGADETASSATQGVDNVTQNTANPGAESNPNAGYDYGYTIPMDLGDLPDTPYPTTVGSNGARHLLTSALVLGSVVDAEYNGQPNGTATGDDDDGTTNIASLPGDTGDDEDGVTQSAGVGGGWKEGTVAGGLGGALFVTIGGGNGVPQVFMDFGSGLTSVPLLTNTGAAAVTGPLSPGGYTFYFDLPTGICPTGGSTDIATRVRLSAAGGLAATGLAQDGEVEDYIFSCSDAPLAVVLADFGAAAQTDHILVTWETVSELDNAGFNLYRSATDAAPEQLLANIASQAPGSAQGAFYSYQDFDVQAGQQYFYWLEAVDFNGSTTLAGPVNAVAQSPTAVTLSGVEADSGTNNLLWLVIVAAGLALAAAYGLRRNTVR